MEERYCIIFLVTSFIIISKEKKKRIDYVHEFCREHDIYTVDITLIEKDTSTKTSLSIGIEDVKNMQKKIFLMPIKSETKAVIIEDAHLLTPEAQNALLKVLEEPPAHTIIMLCSDSIETFLPTIISRCTVITLEQNKQDLSEIEKEALETFIKNIPHASIATKLKYAELHSKNKEDAAIWLEKLLLYLREKLLEFHLGGGTGMTPRENGGEYLHLIKSFQQLHTILKTTNVNPRLAMENMLLNLHLLQ